MTLQIDFWLMISGLGGLVSTFGCIVFWFGKALVKQFSLRLDEKFASRDQKLQEMEEQFANGLTDLTKRIEQAETHARKVERELLETRAELPRDYTRREDYVQQIASIMVKIESLALRVENRLLELFESRGGGR